MKGAIDNCCLSKTAEVFCECIEIVLAHIAVIQRLADSVLLLPGRAFDLTAGGSGHRNEAGWMGVDHNGRDLDPNQAPSVWRSTEKEKRS